MASRMKIAAETDRPMTSHWLVELFSPLEKLKENWDGYGSAAPSSELISSAREATALLQASALARCLPWTEPHIGSNERGQILLEWWQGDRSLTIFVRSADQIDYLKAWGADIQTEMEEDELSKISDFVALSRWLHESR